MPNVQQLPMVFPGGLWLGVLRPPAYDVHGDAHFALSHQIGPCSIAWASNKLSRGSDHHDTRDRTLLDIAVPTGQDIRKSDRLQIPAGALSLPAPVVVHVLGEPEHPVNPFTGWAPFIHVLATLYS